MTNPLPDAFVADGAPAKGVEALDAALKRAVECERNGDTSRYDAGVIYKAIRDDALWQLKVTPDGKPRHTAIKAFVRAEMPISFDWFCKMIRVVETFTREQMAKHGASVLCAVLSAPKPLQRKLLDALESGGIRSKRDVQAMTKRSRTPTNAWGSDPISELVKLAANVKKAEPDARAALVAQLAERAAEVARSLAQEPRGATVPVGPGATDVAEAAE